MSLQDGIRAVQQAFSQGTPRWPMYVRQAKQFLRNAIEDFDERKYGFASVVDLLRAAGKEGVLRIERDRQGAVRVFPGTTLTGKPVTSVAAEPVDRDEAVVDTQAVDVETTTGEPDAAAPVEPIDVDADQNTAATEVEPVAETPILEADLETDEEIEEDEINGNIAGVETHIPPNLKPKPAGRKRKSAGPRGAGGAVPRGSRAPKGPRAGKGVKPRARKGAKE